MSSASWPRSNERGSPPAPEAGNRLADGRHLGCSRSRSSSRRSGRRDPGWNRRRSAPNGASWQCRTLQPARPRFHDERCPSGSGWEKTLLTVARKDDARREAALERGALLAREDSTGERSSRRRHPNRYRDGIITRGSGRACRCGLRASRKRGRRAERASARSGCARRGSGGRAGVLADCGGCRSRRAALGPDRKVGGLAPASRSRERRG